MTVAEPLPSINKLSDAPTDVPAYSTLEIRSALLVTDEPNTMTFAQAENKLPGIVLRFQLPSEPADVRRLLNFSTIRVNVVDVPFSIPHE